MEFETQSDIDRQNPLLREINEPRFEEWGAILRHDPRERWSKPYGRVPESYIEEIERLRVPTFSGKQISATLMRLLVASLRCRNPVTTKPLRFIAYLAGLQNEKRLDIEKLDFSGYVTSAAGAVIQGPTGCAKTHSIESFMKYLPRVVPHGRHPQGGWDSLQQLVYLRVHMPSDHSRSSFLIGIAAEMDEVLKTTNYLSDIVQIKGNEKQLIFIITKLVIHQCGMLFVEEVQLQNSKVEVWAKEFVTFFLRIMNAGVPLVLVGNPTAFENILNWSQPLRRLAKGGIFNLMPGYDELDHAWLIPAREIWSWTVFDKADQYVPDDALLYKISGGFYGYLALVRKETLTWAHRLNSESVQEVHLHMALASAGYREISPVIAGYVAKTTKPIALHSDEPITFIEAEWAQVSATRRMLAGGNTTKM